MKIISFCFLVLLFSSCRQNTQEEKVMSEQELSDHLTQANKLRVQKESEQIDEFVQRHQFKTEETGTGLRIQIYEHVKDGVPPVIHEEVAMTCRVFLLDGTLCYESDTTNPVRFKLGEGMEVRGLEEGIMRMNPGEKARLIIPNHLAYGLSGDGDKIPPGATLFIDVKLLREEK